MIKKYYVHYLDAAFIPKFKNIYLKAPGKSLNFLKSYSRSYSVDGEVLDRPRIKLIRGIQIRITNSLIGEKHPFKNLVIESLIDYVEMLKKDEAGNSIPERYSFENGNVLTVEGIIYNRSLLEIE